jgi:hypothetical protein
MKISWKEAVAFFVSMGFSKAETEWDADKMRTMLSQVPEKVKPEQVSEEYSKLYKGIMDAGGKVELTGIPEEGKAKKETDKPEKKQSKIDRAVDSAAKKKKDTADKKAKSDGKATKKPAAAKKEKPAKTPRKVDKYGAGLNTIRAKINAQFPKDWMSDEEIAKAAGVKRRQARIRLRRAVKGKILEVRRRIEYRLVPAKSK